MGAPFHSERHSQGFAKFNHPINLPTFMIWEFSEFTTFEQQSLVTPINILSLNCTSSYFPGLSVVWEAMRTTGSLAPSF